MKVVVYHRGIGCDTGCCGHAIKIDDSDTDYAFDYEHPYGEDPKAFAEDLIRRELGEEHVADLDWDNCEVIDD